MLTFALPWLALLLPVPFFIRQQQTQVSGHLHLPLYQADQLEQLSAKGKRPAWFFYVLWAMLVLACMRPQWIGEPIELPAKGRDLMLAVDLSGSMQIEDMQVQNRLVDRFTVVQAVVSDFIESRKGDRLGLILFADHAYLQAPLTGDRRSVAQFMREAEIGLVGSQTAIGGAIGLAVKRFEQLEESNRVLILLTDGSSNAGQITPMAAAKIAAERGVTIYTIGVGAEMIEQRTLFGKQQVNPSQDLDERTLIDIAKQTGGLYFRARNPEELQQIYGYINELQPVARDGERYRPQAELFYYPLTMMLILSLVVALWQHLALGQHGRFRKSQS